MRKKRNRYKIGDTYLGKYEIIGIHKFKYLGKNIEELILNQLTNKIVNKLTRC